MRFRDALAGPGLAAIAEIKRRSPSAGDLRPDADPTGSRATSRRRALRRSRCSSTSASAAHPRTCPRRGPGRRCRSSPRASSATRTRSLQLQQLGADAVLLLLRDLDDRSATRLMAAARKLNLDTLVEAHTAAELDRAVSLGADPIGINARDLYDVPNRPPAQLDLVAQATLQQTVTKSKRVVVAESGIESRAQAAAAELAGADAVLVGSALMRAADPGAKLREILARPLVKVCGLTREEDVSAAAEAGADLAGFILAAESPRRAEQRARRARDDALRRRPRRRARGDAGRPRPALRARERPSRARRRSPARWTLRSRALPTFPGRKRTRRTTCARPGSTGG